MVSRMKVFATSERSNPAADDKCHFRIRGEGEWGLWVQLPDDHSKLGSLTHLLEYLKLKFMVVSYSFQLEKEKEKI